MYANEPISLRGGTMPGFNATFFASPIRTFFAVFGAFSGNRSYAEMPSASCITSVKSATTTYIPHPYNNNYLSLHTNTNTHTYTHTRAHTHTHTHTHSHIHTHTLQTDLGVLGDGSGSSGQCHSTPILFQVFQSEVVRCNNLHTATIEWYSQSTELYVHVWMPPNLSVLSFDGHTGSREHGNGNSLQLLHPSCSVSISRNDLRIDWLLGRRLPQEQHTLLYCHTIRISFNTYRCMYVYIFIDVNRYEIKWCITKLETEIWTLPLTWMRKIVSIL